MHPTTQYHQRKDLHLFVVLDDHSDAIDSASPCLPFPHSVLPKNACLLDVPQIQSFEERSYQCHHQEEPIWRLDAHLPSWSEHRLFDIQRCDARAG